MGRLIFSAINKIIELLGGILTFIVSVLPNSPFSDPSLPPASVNLGYITWFLDFPTMIQHFILVLTAAGIYYVYRVALRWIKVARG